MAAFSTTTVCVGDSTHLTDLTTPVPGDPFVSWNWTLPGGSPATSTLVNPVSLFTPGTHSVTLVVTTQTGCHNTITKPVNVFGLPVPNFTSPPVCVGLVTTITNTSTSYTGDPISQNNWSFPGGNPATSTAVDPTVTYPIGTYTVSLVTVSAAGCKDSVKVPVTVNPPPVAGLKGTNACFNNQNSFTDLSVGNNTVTSWFWNFGNGNTDTIKNPSHTFSTPGVHTVTLVVTNNFGCKDTNTINIVVNPIPTVSFASTPVCKGDSTCFINTSTISTGNIAGWAWNFGDLASGTANTSSLQAPCHVFSGLGPYSVVLTATSDSSCQSNVTLPATIYPIPKANFIPKNTCVHSPVTFTDASTSTGIPINLWNWDFNSDGVIDATVQNPTFTFNTAGNYTVTLIVANTGGCRDTVSLPIKVYPPPVANFVGTNSGCSPVCNQYTDSSNANGSTITQYIWSFPGGNPSSSSLQNPLVCYNTAGTYGASLTITSNYGCRDSISLNPMVNVYAWPNAAFCVSPDIAPATD
ncbi:MAG TPA: PKD domain-containing protein, partial [Bacteroidia bacterium]